MGADPYVEPRGGDVPWAALGRRPARLLLGAGQERLPTGLCVPLVHTGGCPSFWGHQWWGRGLRGHNFVFSCLMMCVFAVFLVIRVLTIQLTGCLLPFFCCLLVGFFTFLQ